MSSGSATVRLVIPVALLAIGGSACSASSSATRQSASPDSGSSSTPTAQTAEVGQVARCQSVLPSGYRVDSAHSGSVTATSYSAAADVQAALEYDQLKAGQREIYLHRSGGRVDAVASCVRLTFSSAHDAQRFFDSYQALRRSAGKLAKRITIRGSGSASTVPAGTVGYRELDQGFAGYGIRSTTVIEAAAVTGTSLTIVSTADRAAAATTSARLLAAVEGSA